MLRVTATVNPFGSVEEFEDQLERLITQDARARDQRPVDRIIFFIDDLDRCRDELVVEAIETLQAFFGRERCVYIVAADRDQLRRAVRRISVGPASAAGRQAAIPADESFLEKIFQVAVEVPPPLGATLTDYAQTLARAAGRIEDPEIDTIVDYLLHAEVDSPRQVRVILNEFTMALDIAHERETAPDAHLAHSPLTANKALLAKFVVLRVHYPWFYALLPGDPELLIRAQARAEAMTMRTQVAESDEAAWNRVRKAAAISAGQQIEFEDIDDAGETEPPSHQQGNEAAEVAKRRVDSLEGFLFQTLDTPATDSVQIEEFIYLRGRQEFENLPGAEGSAYRRAMMQGDTRRIDELARSSPTLLTPALEAAVARLNSARAVERPRIRRAALALAAQADAAALTALGRPTLDALYRDEFMLDEEMANDDVAGLRALVPYMRADELNALIAGHELNDPDDLITFAKQAHRLSSPKTWSTALNRLSADASTLEALRERIDELDLEEASGLIEPTLSSLRPVVQAPSTWLEEAATVTGWNAAEHELTVTRADGTSLIFEIPNELSVLAADYVANSRVQVEATRAIDGSWTAVALGDAEDVLTSVETPPLRVTDETRDTALGLIEDLAERANANAGALTNLLLWDYPNGDAWAAGLEPVITALHRVPGQPKSIAEAGVRAAERVQKALADLEEESATRLASTCILLIAATCEVAVEHLRPQAVDLLVAVIGLVRATNAGARSALSQALHSARRAFGAALVYETAKRELPSSFATRRLVIRTVVGPIDAGRALTLALDDINDAAKRQRNSEDEKEQGSLLTTIREYLRLIEEVSRKTARSRKQLARLPLVADRTYAGNAIRLVDEVNAEFNPPTHFVLLAASAGLDALTATSSVLLRAGRTTDPDLNAVLSGIGQAALRKETLSPTVESYQRSAQARVPRLEQHGRIAGLVGWSAAERVGGERILEDLLSSAAKLMLTAPDQAQVRMELAEGWRAAPQTRKRTAANGYVQLLAEARTTEQLTAVVESLHRFFDGGTPPEIAALREAVYKAIPRVFGKHPPSPEMAETLSDQLNAVGLLGTSSKPAPARVRKLLAV